MDFLLFAEGDAYSDVVTTTELTTSLYMHGTMECRTTTPAAQCQPAQTASSDPVDAVPGSSENCHSIENNSIDSTPLLKNH